MAAEHTDREAGCNPREREGSRLYERVSCRTDFRPRSERLFGKIGRHACSSCGFADHSDVRQSMKSSLRAFTADDVQLLERSIREGDAFSFMSRCLPHSFSQGCWSDELTRWHMIVAEGREIGSIWMERRSNSETTCDLGILIFDPISRGRGFGAEAIRLAEQDASAGWGVDLVRLRVRDSNQRAISCYRRCGYRISTVTLKEIDGNRIRILHMEHRLSIS